MSTLKCLLAGGVGLNGGVGIVWTIQLVGVRISGGGVGIMWKLQVIGVRLSGGLICAIMLINAF